MDKKDLIRHLVILKDNYGDDSVHERFDRVVIDEAIAYIEKEPVLVAELKDVKRLLETDTLIAACTCYSDKTNGSMTAFYALDNVKLRVEQIIDKISNITHIHNIIN